MRKVLGGIVLLAALAAAQASKTAEEVAAYIRTAVASHYKDADVAASLEHLRLTTRLDAKVVTDLQRLGAGPKTVAVLTRLGKASESLAASAPKPEPVLPPAPSAAEQQQQLIGETRDNALNYTRTLPDYMCRQVTKRHVDPDGSGWRDTDQIVEQLTFFEQKESYKVVMVNNTMVTNNLQHDQLGGSTSSGEFGSILRAIFAPESQTEFGFERWTGLHGKWQAVFSFRAAQPIYTIRHGESKRTINTRAHGQVFLDRETKMVSRIHFECEGIPEDFPIRAVTIDQDYDFADIGGQQYMLPMRSDVRSREARYQSWNEVTFSGYRKFSADTNITFK
jgi:hypothetical protein